MSDIEKHSSEPLSDSLDIKAHEDLSPQQQIDKLAIEYGVNHRKLMWKVDLCVVPPFCFLYFLSFLDRVNISNAALYGMSTDLGLVGNQFNTALTVFFVPYIFFEVISNYIIKKVKPHVWLSSCILGFGAVSIGMGFVKNFGGLVACRFLVGMAESGTFPSLFYLLSTYYSKAEAQRRFSAFFSATCLAGAASGAIAYRINDLDGVHGIASWSWIFIIDGIITCGGAVILFFTVADFPEESRFLKENEIKFIKKKLEILSGANSGFEIAHKIKDVAKCFKDYLMWLPALAYFGLIIPSYGYAYFAATIISEMGYTATSAQQHSVYPWLVAFGMNIIVAVISDKMGRRLPFVIMCSVIAIAGLAMVLGAPTNPKVRYGGCFLAVSGLYTAMPVLICWTSLNFQGHLRKSVGTAWQIGFGNIGGIIATFIFLTKDAPVYRPGLAVSISAICFSICITLIYFFSIYRLNRVKQSEQYIAEFEALESKDQILKGDKNPKFKYTY